MGSSEGSVSSVSVSVGQTRAADLPAAVLAARHAVLVALVADIALCGVGCYLGEVNADSPSLDSVVSGRIAVDPLAVDLLQWDPICWDLSRCVGGDLLRGR